MADWMETIAPKGLGWGRFFEIYHTQLNLFPYIPSSHQVWRIMLECKMIRLVHGNHPWVVWEPWEPLPRFMDGMSG